MKNRILSVSKGLLSAFVAAIILASAAFLPAGQNAGVHTAGGLSVQANAYTSGNLTYSVSSGKVTITGCNNTSIEEIIIPSKINGYPVVSIGAYAFDYLFNLRCVKLPSGLVSIGEFAFSFCYDLFTINLPLGLKSIGEDAFLNCDLYNFIVPPSVTYIGPYAFGYLYIFSDLNEHQPMEDFRMSCYANSTAEKFAKSNDIRYSILPVQGSCGNGLKWSLNMTEGILTISGSGKMWDFNSESRPSWVGSDGYIRSVIINKGVTNIDDNAFWRDDQGPGFPEPNLTMLSISVPSTVTGIADMTFHYCVTLSKINVDSGNQYYSSINGVLYDKAKTRLICYPSGNHTKVFTIPDTLKTIAGTAFNEWCISFTSFSVKSANTAFSAKDGVLFNKNGTVLIKYPSSNTRKMYYMPEGIKTIESLSFQKCKYLQNVRFSSTVETIRFMAFNCCYLIKGMLIPRNVKSIEYGSLEIAYTYATGGYNSSVLGFKVYCFKNTEGERYAREMSDGGVQCVIVAEPAAVNSLKIASASYNSVKISWDAVSGVTGYVVYRYNSSTKKYERIGSTTMTNFTNTSLTTGRTYYYKVIAYKTVNGINIYSTASAAVSTKPVPATPSNFKAVRYGSTSIKLTWDIVTGASGYVVYKYNDSTKVWDRLRVQAATSYINTGLTTGVTYYYKVRAYRTMNGSPIYGNPTAAVSAKTY